MIILILIIFIAIILAAYFFDITGIKSFDHSSAASILGIFGILAILIAIFAELLHASGVISVYIGDMTPLGDNTVPTIYFVGAGLTLLSALLSKNRAVNTGKAIGFSAASGILGFIGFIFIALSAM